MIHNLYTFQGADHKVGTTMVAQSVAEIISANHSNLKILFIAVNGRESAEYIRETPVGIDAMKFHIDNRMINGKDFLNTCTHKGNFYIMAGVSNELEARCYHPDMGVYLLEEAAPEFDLVIADSGNELDNGLAVGALSVSDEIFLVVTQQESVIKRFEKNRAVLADLGFEISNYVINKFFDLDPYGLPYIADRLGEDKDRFLKIASGGYSNQAEIDSKTLLQYKNEHYQRDITVLANHILRKRGFPEVQGQRKNRWKSFI